MHFRCLSMLICLMISCNVSKVQPTNSTPDPYIKDITDKMKIQWPANKTINIVFHGHSVPAGYFKTPTVNTMEAYPMQTLWLLKEKYPFAVINAINTAIGGENSISGAKRFEQDVLSHRPDIVFIDYALNDRGPGLAAAQAAWQQMIDACKHKGIRVYLVTPSPDQRENILDPKAPLQQHTDQIIALATRNNVGLIDAYSLFKQSVAGGTPVEKLMSQVNHPNAKGHRLIAEEIMRRF
jgi:acyl-CoA thioesterase-1